MPKNNERKIEDQIESLIGRGDIALFFQVIPKALRKYKKAAKLDPSSGEAFFSLGEFFRFIGKWRAADKCYRLAVKLSPQSFYKYRHAFLLKEMGEFREAAQLLQQVVEEQPDDSFYHFALGEILWEVGNMEGVLYHWKRAVELAPLDDFYHAWLGVALVAVGCLDEAEKEFIRAHKLRPENPLYLCLLGDVYNIRGDSNKAGFYYWLVGSLSPYDEVSLRKFRSKLYR